MKFRPKLLVAKSFKVLFLTYRYEFSLLNAILFIKICFEDLVQHENKRYYLISSTKAMIILCILHSSLLSLICGNKFRRNRVLVSHVRLNFVSAILFINSFRLFILALGRSCISVTLSSPCVPTPANYPVIVFPCKCSYLVYSVSFVSISSHF